MTDRPLIIGPDSGPEPPFPLRMGGEVVSGFGRGSKELGIPTANIPVPTAESSWISTAQSGVYFGWASILLPPSHPSLAPSPSVISSTKILDASFVPPVCPLAVPTAKAEQGWRIYPMVMSIGYNPFYKNTVRSAEVHVLNGFEKDFYGAEMRVLILGFIREEKDYASLQALVEDIKVDCEVAGRSLGRRSWGPGQRDEGWLTGEGKADGESE